MEYIIGAVTGLLWGALVAWLNSRMWAELFLENRDYLLEELDFYISSLTAYREAIAAQDSAGLIALLEEGKRRKEEVDG